MAELIQIPITCSKCGKPLTIEEIHYYGTDKGATCNGCEGLWLEEVEAWRRGEKPEFPSR